MAVIYEPKIGPGGGVARLLRSREMQSFMQKIGSLGAQRAASYSPTPGALRSEVVMSRDRWTTNVINTAPDARWQEYGGRRTPPLHPLARGVLDVLWSTDPHRRRGFSARLSNR